MNSLLFVLVLLSIVTSSRCINCYDDDTHCTPKVAFPTGIMWKSCTQYCQKCHAREVGKCIMVDNMQCSGGYRCKCSGEWLNTISMNPLEIDTCALGLDI